MNTIKKPTVKYTGEVDYLKRFSAKDNKMVEIGVLNVINHPELGSTRIYTSKIVNKSDNGNFESLNTFYEKLDK